MGNSVDKRVVQLEFDNAQFEAGVRESLTSLEELNHKLSFDNLKTTGLDKLSETLSNSKLSGLASHFNPVIEKISEIGALAGSTFSTVTDKISGSAKGFLTALTGINVGIGAIAMQGGIKRALNIEQAEFMLKNLGVDVEQIMKDVNYAVGGTRFGLDEAAVAASSLAASGVEADTAMKTALRGISGVATMTNAEYSEMARIFTAVAGQGKVMTIQLRQMELRGLNGAAAIANYLEQVEGLAGITEAEIREMVTAGQIDFETFANAMDWAFGEGATKANETFTGALANVRAALSRIGEKFVTPVMEGLRRVFVELIPNIDNLKNAITPLADAWGIAFLGMADAVALLLKGWNNSHIVQAIGVVIKFVADVIYNAGLLAVKGIQTLAAAVGTVINVFIAIGSVIFEPLKQLGLLIYQIFGQPVVDKVVAVKNAFVGFFEELKNKIDAYKPVAKTPEEIKESMLKLAKSLQFLFNVVKLVGSIALAPLVWGFTALKDAILGIPDFVVKVKNKLVELGFPVEELSNLFSLVNDSLSTFLGLFNEGLPTFDDLSGFLTTTKEKFDEWKNSSDEAFGNFFENSKEFAKTKISNGLDKFGVKLEDVNGKVVDFSAKAEQLLKSLGLPQPVNDFLQFVIDLATFLPRLAEKMQELGFPLQELKDLFGLSVRGLEEFLNLFKDGTPTWEEFTTFLEKVRTKFDEWKDSSSDAFDSFADSFKAWAKTKVDEAFNRLSEKLDEFKEKIKNLPQHVSEAFKSLGIDPSLSGLIEAFFGGLANGLDYLTGPDGIFSGVDLGKLGEQLGGIGSAIGDTHPLKTFADEVQNAGDALKSGSDKVKESGKNFSDGLSEFKEGINKNLDKETLYKLMSLIATVGLVFTLVYAVRELSTVAKLLAKGPLANALAPIGSALNKFGKAAEIEAVSNGVLKLAIALFVLSKVPIKELAKSLIALGLALVISVKALKSITKIFKDSKLASGDIVKVSGSLTLLATTLLILAVACRLFASVPIKGMVKAGVALAALIGVLYLLGRIAKKYTADLGNMAASMVILSVALFALGIACIAWTLVPWYGMLKAAVALGVFMTAAAVLSKISSKTGSFVKLAVSMAVLSTALGQLAVSCLLFALVPIGGMLKAGSALVGLIAAVAMLSLINTETKGLGQMAADLALISASLIVLAVACAAFSVVNVGGMLKAGAALAALIGALALLSMIKAFKASSMQLMVGILVQLAGVLVILAAAGIVFNLVPWGSIAKGLVVLVVALAALVGVGALLGFVPEVAVGLLLFAEAVKKLGEACLAAGIGVLAFSAGMLILSIVGPTVMTAMLVALEMLLDGIVELAPKIANAVAALIKAICQAILDSLSTIAATGALLLIALMEGILAYIPRIGDLAVAIILTFISKLTEYAEVIIQAGINLILNLVNGLADGIRENSDRAEAALENFANTCLAAFAKPFKAIPWVGGWIDDHIINPAEQAASEASDKFESLGDTSVQSWIDSIRSGESDSQSSGFNLIEMFKNGILENSSDFNVLGENTAFDFTDSFNSGLDSGLFDMEGILDKYGSEIPTNFEDMLSDLSNVGDESVSSLVDSIGSGEQPLYSESKSVAAFAVKGTEEGIKPLDSKVKSAMTKAKSPISTSGIELRRASISAFKNVPSGAASGSSTVGSKVRNNVAPVPGIVSSYGDSARDSGYGVGTNIGAGMERGILAYASRVATASANMVKQANAAAKAESKEGSPSRVMYQKGVWYAQGFILGMQALYSDVKKASGGMVRGAIDSTVEGFGELSSALDGIDYNPVIRPVFDGSQLESGIRNANRLMVQNQMLSAGYAGRQYPTFTPATATNGYINNISIALNYDAGADANQIVRDLGMALRSRNIMEG